jgi:hypothetical protein
MLSSFLLTNLAIEAADTILKMGVIVGTLQFVIIFPFLNVKKCVAAVY